MITKEAVSLTLLTWQPVVDQWVIDIIRIMVGKATQVNGMVDEEKLAGIGSKLAEELTAFTDTACQVYTALGEAADEIIRKRAQASATPQSKPGSQ